jgi:hypothetical protein
MTCPACGIAVVPGYARCPKCHAELGGPRAAVSNPGGTAIDRRPLPIVPIVVAVAVAAAVIAFVATRRSGSGEATPPPAELEPAIDQHATITQPVTPAAPGSASQRRPDPDAIAGQVDRALKRAHLWSTVGAAGSRLDIRSTSCNDPGLARIVDGARGALREAGLVRLRCAEQNGKIVFERDL